MVYPPWYDRTEEHYKILLAFSGLQHALSSKPGYNLRVAECQEAARILLRAAGKESGESLLGKVTIEEYTTHQGLLHGDLAKRAKHFFTESARVCAGIDAWSSGNLEAFGKLMSQSGLSSIHNYECGDVSFLCLSCCVPTSGFYPKCHISAISYQYVQKMTTYS